MDPAFPPQPPSMDSCSSKSSNQRSRGKINRVFSPAPDSARTLKRWLLCGTLAIHNASTIATALQFDTRKDSRNMWHGSVQYRMAIR
eukprot:12549828-Alexandrium_andersonii.AAC.1